MTRQQKTTLGVIVSNRGFFPDHLCESGRKAILKALRKAGMNAVILPESAGKFGSVETLADARACADLFSKHRDKIDGVLVTLPNFGDERAVANVLRWSGLNVPVLVHAFPDNPETMAITHRRDSFCGKMSVCNNLRQYDIPFTLTTDHVCDPESDLFVEDLAMFGAVCRVVRGLRHARIGMVGARPAAFNTVRFSEKILEYYGISVETLDLSELLGWAQGLKDGDERVNARLEELCSYTKCGRTPSDALKRMARLGVALDKWMRDTGVTATAVQCWTSLEQNYGVVPCALMSMMSENLLPSACETDVPGLISMMALQFASGKPSALLDWNNNYGDDPDKAVLFHCSNLPQSFFTEHRMDYQEIIAGTVGKENTHGTIVGRIKPGPFTFCRITTDDLEGEVLAYVGEGIFTDDRLSTFGGYGVAEIPGLQELLAYICENGFEHHVACNLSEVADAVAEAFEKYLGWDVYLH